ncbi:MAG: hypothetical protein ACRCZS_23800 [Chroococcidiopsis sp.]
MTNTGYLKDNTPFNHIFPDGKVPLCSIFSAIPREKGAPPCYWVDGSKLTPHQIEELAKLLYPIWQNEMKSLEEAREYVSKELPLKADWFSSRSTDSLFFLGDEGDGVDEAIEQEEYDFHVENLDKWDDCDPPDEITHWR